MEEIRFEDAEGYASNFGKDKISFREIILHHLKDIGRYSSVEFRGGFWQTKVKYVGSAALNEDIYVPDTREIYSNAVEYLADMLYPYFDQEMHEAEEKAKQLLAEAFKDNSVAKQPDREDQHKNDKQRHFPDTRHKISYRSERRRINRDLFRALCSFLYRKKYLELGSIED